MKRDLGKADEIFDVPAINFFTSGNDYFGSSGSKFRYRISHTDEMNRLSWIYPSEVKKIDILLTF